MGRIITQVKINNALDMGKSLQFDALVDTGTSILTLPLAWKDRLGTLKEERSVKVETADQRIVDALICGPVQIQLEGFRPIFSEVIFLEMQPQDGAYESLVGYIVLEQSLATIDMVGHRLIPVKSFDLKITKRRPD